MTEYSRIVFDQKYKCRSCGATFINGDPIENWSVYHPDMWKLSGNDLVRYIEINKVIPECAYVPHSLHVTPTLVQTHVCVINGAGIADLIEFVNARSLIKLGDKWVPNDVETEKYRKNLNSIVEENKKRIKDKEQNK